MLQVTDIKNTLWDHENVSNVIKERRNNLGTEGRDSKSIDFLLYMIMGVDFAKKEDDETLSIRESFAIREISNQFPDRSSLLAKNPSSYMLRKDIILLYFYYYWVNDFLTGSNEGDYDGFSEGLNDILDECGFSPLYAGNPYDWLFLYCSACAIDDYSPLDRFRGLIAQENESGE